MKSFVTSYNSMFTRCSPDAPDVKRVEIPFIQRDYAQGREGTDVKHIRDGFLKVIHDAVTTPGKQVNLDFIYGDVQEETLHPLDGQQRLTTLFLLHWYLAFRADRMEQEQGWKQFTYATRASARLFCERLVKSQPPQGEKCLSWWIKDQPWYLYPWRHDPSIQSMLVVLDAMHQLFLEDDCLAAWGNLVNPHKPAISFHLLPIAQMGLSEDLYIKMNSRGRPLTPFENFKARFEQTIEASCPERVKEFALKVDGVWSDLLWRYHGGDYKVDDEFMRYFQFVIEICEWRKGRLASEEFAPLAEAVFGPDNPEATTHLDFMFRAFDTWVDVDIDMVFRDLFTTAPAPLESGETARVVIFSQQADQEANLFSACCRNYGIIQGRNRVFSLPQTILLYAVLLHRLHETPNFARRLRIIRNLVEASDSELRLERMPALIAEVERIVVVGSLEGVDTFNQSQVADERLKEDLLTGHPELETALFQLEDHSRLRGCLAAFDLAPETFEQRACTFHQLFSNPDYLMPLTGALLATGDYSRHLNGNRFRLGSATDKDTPWRKILTGAGRSDIKPTRDVLGRLLDEVAQAEGNPYSCLNEIQTRWLKASEEKKVFGWRYYFVKYPIMREGKSGIYVGLNGALGYSICMLDRLQLNSWYRDPFLSAIHQKSEVGDAVEKLRFTGYETEPRYIKLKKSRIELRCFENSIALKPPLDTANIEAFLRVCAQHSVGNDNVLLVPYAELEGQRVDTNDRVQMGAALLRDLVEAGL